MPGPGPGLVARDRRKLSQRTEQVESLLQRLVSDIVRRDLSDPRLEGLISITSVSVSPDMKQAKLMVSVMPDQHGTKVIHALRRAAGHVQRMVRDRSALRSVPILVFELDESLKKQAEIYAAIQRGIEREDKDSATRPTPSGQADRVDGAESVEPADNGATSAEGAPDLPDRSAYEGT